MPKRKKILFMAEGITMTHFARPAALASTLDPAEWDVCFCTPQRYHGLLQQEFTQLGDLRTINPQAFLESLACGACLYTVDALEEYVRQDMEIFEKFHPDLVIGDFRLSLCISAPLAGIPFASIFNAQWSPYRKQPAIVPELPISRWVPPRLLNCAYSVLRPKIYAAHARPVNELRRRYGLAAISDDLREIYTTGDMVFYPDVPEFVPTCGAPEHHHYIGVCEWACSHSRPDWWDDVMQSPDRKIFVTLGSSGAVKALPAIMNAVAGLDVKVILATSSRVAHSVPGVYSAPLLPYEETARNCELVISHGGTGGLYHTLAAGTPMLAIPNNIDNHLSTALMEGHGAGIGIRVEQANAQRIRRAITRLMEEPSYKNSAMQWSQTIRRYEWKQLFPQILAQWFAAREEPGTKHEPIREVCAV